MAIAFAENYSHVQIRNRRQQHMISAGENGLPKQDIDRDCFCPEVTLVGSVVQCTAGKPTGLFFGRQHEGMGAPHVEPLFRRSTFSVGYVSMAGFLNGGESRSLFVYGCPVHFPEIIVPRG